MNKNIKCNPPVLLQARHQVDDFDCGEEELNQYLKRYAYYNNQNRSARTFVSVYQERVIAYYTLTVGSVARERAPERVAKGLGRYPVPVCILARLAVTKKYQKQKIGQGLLKNALLRILNAADQIGGRAVLVHAKNEQAKKFYFQFGFEQSSFEHFHLYLLLKDLKISLGK